jgi:hypothetical protein
MGFVSLLISFATVVSSYNFSTVLRHILRISSYGSPLALRLTGALSQL